MTDLLIHYPDWHAKAACLGIKNPDIFFPKKVDDEDARKARALCRSCPVARECFGTAIAAGERWGIRGGHSPKARTQIAKKVLGAARQEVRDAA
jgi:WhiB family redox-sensing transcriptional regulator